MDKLSAAESTFKEMQLRMADPDVAANAAEFQRVAKAAADLELTSLTYQKHKEAEQQLADSQAYLKEVSSDPEMAELVREEISELQTQLVQLETKLKMLLLPKDPLDEKNIMLEIRAGAGGDEAGIWAGDLYRMYTRCAPRVGSRLGTTPAQYKSPQTYAADTRPKSSPKVAAAALESALHCLPHQLTPCTLAAMFARISGMPSAWAGRSTCSAPPWLRQGATRRSSAR